MKFEEVLPALRAGKKVQHKDWKSKLDFSISLESTPSTLLILGEVLSNDWEIVKDKVKKTIWVNVYRDENMIHVAGAYGAKVVAEANTLSCLNYLGAHSITVEVDE
jgi:hypothetical protein